MMIWSFTGHCTVPSFGGRGSLGFLVIEKVQSIQSARRFNDDVEKVLNKLGQGANVTLTKHNVSLDGTEHVLTKALRHAVSFAKLGEDVGRHLQTCRTRNRVKFDSCENRTDNFFLI